MSASFGEIAVRQFVQAVRLGEVLLLADGVGAGPLGEHQDNQHLEDASNGDC
jgi:hypothetical protein